MQASCQQSSALGRTSTHAAASSRFGPWRQVKHNHTLRRLDWTARLQPAIPGVWPDTGCLLLSKASRQKFVCYASGQTGFARVDVIKRELGLQSNKLNADIRERVELSIEQHGFRVTVGDVAARAGIKIAEADEALKALAYDTTAALEVSTEGDIIYAFKPDFRTDLRNTSMLQRVRPIATKVGEVLSYMARVSFGVALVTSVAVVWVAITALLTARSDDRDRGRGSSSGGYHYARGPSLDLVFNLTDLFYYFDPYYYRTSQERRANGESMSFLEAIFSFVFGDGDPNAAFEERRWAMLGEVIQAKGGAMTAEELAPFLDPPELRPHGPNAPAYEDESFVLPALIKFGGEAVVDEQGRLLYVFPALQRSGSQAPFSTAPSEAVPLEDEIELTAASPAQLLGVVALGIANVVGVALLAGMLMDPANRQLLVLQGLGWVMGLMPGLQLYAAAFFAIPAVRWCLNVLRNQSADNRNAARTAAAEYLAGSRSRLLAEKLSAARKLAQRRVLHRSDSIFRTDVEDAAAQQVADREAAEWDAAFRRRRTP